ncbi:hypothetical protein I4000191A8_06140 [Clostridia bacterium i40-0019-1A8]
MEVLFSYKSSRNRCVLKAFFKTPKFLYHEFIKTDTYKQPHLSLLKNGFFS